MRNDPSLDFVVINAIIKLIFPFMNLTSFTRVRGALVCTVMMLGLAVAQSALGQDSFDFRAGDMLILQAKEIQTALGVTAAQRSKMNGFAEATRAKMEAYKKELIKAKKKQADPNRVAGFELDLKKQVFGTLTPAQLKRLREISLQHDGVGALGDDGVAKKVGLSADQLKKVRAIIIADRKQLSELQEKADGPIVNRYKNVKPKDDADRKALGAKFRQELSAAGAKFEPQVKAVILGDRKKLMDVLTPAQRATWQSLLGKPFKA